MILLRWAVDGEKAPGTRNRDAYDPFNRRIARRVDEDGDGHVDRAQHFVYDTRSDGLDPIALVFDGAGSLTNRYLHGPLVDQVLADEQLAAGAFERLLWPLADNLGTIRDLAQFDAAAGQTDVASHRTYDAYGNLTGQSAPIDHLFAFTGRELDRATGLQYHRARWYDPPVGRWLSEDPIGFAAGDANLVRYVANSPTLLADPSGRISVGRTGTPFRRTGTILQRNPIRDMLKGTSFEFQWDANDRALLERGETLAFAQKVVSAGSFVMRDSSGTTHSVDFTESYVEYWPASKAFPRGNLATSVDNHYASPNKPALYLLSKLNEHMPASRIPGLTPLRSANTWNFMLLDGKPFSIKRSLFLGTPNQIADARPRNAPAGVAPAGCREIVFWEFKLRTAFSLSGVALTSSTSPPNQRTAFFNGTNTFNITDLVIDGTSLGAQPMPTEYFTYMLWPNKAVDPAVRDNLPGTAIPGTSFTAQANWTFTWNKGDIHTHYVYADGYA